MLILLLGVTRVVVVVVAIVGIIATVIITAVDGLLLVLLRGWGDRVEELNNMGDVRRL